MYRKAWAAGTGYGSDIRRPGLSAAPIWDAKHAEASQAAQDAELEKLLIELTASELEPIWSDGYLFWPIGPCRQCISCVCQAGIHGVATACVHA